jgi:class 3 adenylate cyclase
MADLFDGIIDWLTSRALGNEELAETIALLGTRLIDGGVPVCRLNIGRTILHPLIGMSNVTWEQDTGQVRIFSIARNKVNDALKVHAPFQDLMIKKYDVIVAQLTNPDDVARYPIFQELADEGITGYAAFARNFGIKQTVLSDLGVDFRGAGVSFCTKRFNGFSQSDLDGLARLITPLCICVRIANDRFLTRELLETYLGRISGTKVLHGHSARGDGQAIECALFFSDMRNSLGLSQSMELDAYLATVNRYFECTAGAVLDHGGEVLKFIGDGVLAIFPIEDGTRPRANMCAAALSAAREAFARAEHINAGREKDRLPPFGFGIALHVGSVIYGNVGTEKRLDFTATGPAVGMVTCCEALTREAGVALIATQEFAEHCPDKAQPVGDFEIRGFPGTMSLASYPLQTQ